MWDVDISMYNSRCYLNKSFFLKHLSSLDVLRQCALPIFSSFPNLQVNKKYVLSKSESVQCNFFIFDRVTFIQFKICCCVQNFIKIR